MSVVELMKAYELGKSDGRAELLKEVVDHLREWAAHASRERDGRVVRNAANYLETRFGAGEHSRRTEMNDQTGWASREFVVLALNLPISAKCHFCNATVAIHKEDLMQGKDLPSPCGCHNSWLVKWYKQEEK